MKVTLLNVKYSPNLGDGIIAECFEHAIRAADPDITVESCDIAGREDFGDGINSSRQLVHSVLDTLPGPLKTLVSANLIRMLIRSRLATHYRTHLIDADIALIGGGQLIADSLLNFPLKVASAAEIARSLNTRIGVFGVGVGSGFSKKGRRLFSDAFHDDLLCCRVRDRDSVERWNRFFPAQPAELVNDPGLLSSRVYPAPEAPARDRRLIGLGVTNPKTLKLHADENTGVDRDQEWIDFYLQLANALIGRGFDVELFTNGAADDIEFAKRIAAAAGDGSLVVMDKMTRPGDLARTIARYDGIIAHRLHANIIAFSYGIPHLGLAWDSKMTGFFERAARLDYLIAKPSGSQINEIADKLTQSVREGVDPDHVRNLQDETETQIQTLVTQIRQNGRAATPILNAEGL